MSIRYKSSPRKSFQRRTEMRILKYIVPMLLVFQVAVFAQKFKKQVTSHANENCKTVGKDPQISVCLDYVTADHKLNKRLLRSVKFAIKELINEQAADDIATLISPQQYGITVDPCEEISCTPGDWTAECCGGAASYCDEFPDDPVCQGL